MGEPNRASRIGLGTAQFGLDYGITNTAGRVAQADACAILELCAEHGIVTIDTAHAYGTSEETIGRCMPTGTDFSIVTKTPVLGAGSADEAIRQVQRGFAQSQARLAPAIIDALLVHHAEDLLGPCGQAVWSAMEGLRDAGGVKRIGVSVYRPDQIDRLLSRFRPQVVQLPYSIVDQRMVSGGQLERLAELGIEVHARSLFLQGLLLLPADRVPTRFAPIKAAIERLDQVFGNQRITRMEGLFADVLRRTEISRAICGVESASQLHTIISAARKGLTVRLTCPELRPIDNVYLDPSRWHELS